MNAQLKRDYLDARAAGMVPTQAALFAEWQHDATTAGKADDMREFNWEIARRSVKAGQNKQVLAAIRLNRMIATLAVGEGLARNDRDIVRVGPDRAECSDGKLRRLGVCGAFLAGHEPAGFGFTEIGVIVPNQKTGIS